MIFTLLSYAPMLALAWISAIVLALTVHEFAHALVGKLLGDDTAERYGRLTLNPLAHLDVFGFLALLFFGFGWAKPVPYDPRNLGSSRGDGLKIALAGPLTNLALAAIAGGVFRVLAFSDVLSPSSVLWPFLLFFVLINLFLAIFNLLPIPPLDGSKILLFVGEGTVFAPVAMWLFRYGQQVLLFAILLSLVTPFDPFVIVRDPSFALCSQFLGKSCLGLLAVYFGG